MIEQNQKHPGKELWAIASSVAPTIDGIREHMLGLLLFRSLSDNYEKAARKELGRNWPEPGRGKKWNGRHTALSEWYKQNPDDVPTFEKQMLLKKRYIIRPEGLWPVLAHKAHSRDEKLIDHLLKTFKHIESKSYQQTLWDLFSEIDLNSFSLGKTYKERNAKLCTIIARIDECLSAYPGDTNTLADAYNYLFDQYSSSSSSKGHDFYTTKQISNILSAIVTLDSQDPKAGKRKKLESVMDPTCGTASLLLNIHKRMGAKNIGKIYGQEKDARICGYARMNMLMHGLKDSEFDIYRGDTLTNANDRFRETNPAKKPRFDAVVANPPPSLRWSAEKNAVTKEDMRFRNYGMGPVSAADFAFLLHGFHYLKEDGAMAILLPHGLLLRGGEEANIRRKLLEDGNIDTVIGLPPNLLYSTAIPTCILVLKKNRNFDDVLFIDASKHFEKGKRQNSLSDEHVRKIIDAYQQRPQNIFEYARRVNLDEIKANDFNLDIRLYLDTELRTQTRKRMRSKPDESPQQTESATTSAATEKADEQPAPAM